MIKFFRKIRSKQLRENKLGKYLLYAMGEIVLVVIGILIALQINNANLRRINTAKERALLEQLQRDLTRAVADITGNIRIHDDAIYSANYVLEHMDSDKPYEDSVGIHLARAFLWSKLVIDLGAYENAKSLGLDIISDQALRNEIVNTLSGKLDFQDHFETIVKEYSEEIRQTIGPKYFKGSYVGIGRANNGPLWGITEPRDYEALRKDPEFRYHLVSFLSLTRSFQQFQNRSFKNRLQSLVESIDSELQ
ncbi:MAG: hypothetical protein Roseis2KO_45150 [Roseivirga sp.]